MHVRQLLIISSLILAGNVAFGADLDRDDVPSDCHSACDPLVSMSQRCDRQTDDDAAEASTAHRACITLRPPVTRRPLVAIPEDSTARPVSTNPRPLTTRLHLLAIGLEDKVVRQARITPRPPVTRRPLVAIPEDSTARRVSTNPRPLTTRLHLLAIGLEDKVVRQAHITPRPPVTRRPLVAIPEDSTAHRVCTILRPVIARLPQRVPLPVPLGTNNDNSIDVPDTTDIQGVRKSV
ncbi:putative GPI anchored protein [Aspergillus foveolatus]|uniref:putative GPI anchored protein n=1 Tax=Aspergillus foveolatus TaxID=210207 RepID=UPI003CCE3C02